jgi:protein-disulfide isomerase
MMKLVSKWGTGLLLVLAMTLPVTAAMLVEGTQSVRLPKAALDVAATADGSRLFVLLKGGEVQVLTPTGEILERLEVAADAERLAASPEGDRIYLTVGQELRMVEVANQYDLPILNSPAKGAANAAVTLTVFSDFQCPYCSRLVPFIDEVLAKNPAQVRVVFKQFPLRMHNMAMPAALASLAAREQGKFWPMHDLLFANSAQLSEDKIRSLAEQAGLDLARFDRDRNALRLREEVQRDMALGQQAGVQGTPTVYLNGKLLRERTAAGVQALIDREVGRNKGGSKSP